jgi:hypothetical protein
MRDAIIVANVGSSSLKISAYAVTDERTKNSGVRPPFALLLPLAFVAGISDTSA